MKINTNVIKELNPCSDRFNNYLEHYNDFEGNLEDFLKLDKITHKDKLWVSLRLLSKTQVVEVACQFAESTLHIFETKFPNDSRPREAIEAARAYSKGNISLEELKVNADAAAYAAYAAYAADAAVYAAYAADAAADAAYAAAYAADATDAAADAAYAAAYAAVYAAARKQEEEKQLQIVLNVFNMN